MTTKDFVIQHHTDIPTPHYDLMLKVNNTLATWQVETNPQLWNNKELTVKKLPDHRLAYLTYQGSVSNNRGYVKIAHKGTYHFLEKSTEKLWLIELTADTIIGRLSLEQLDEDTWKLRFNGVCK